MSLHRACWPLYLGFYFLLNFKLFPLIFIFYLRDNIANSAFHFFSLLFLYFLVTIFLFVLIVICKLETRFFLRFQCKIWFAPSWWKSYLIIFYLSNEFGLRFKRTTFIIDLLPWFPTFLFQIYFSEITPNGRAFSNIKKDLFLEVAKFVWKKYIFKWITL